MPAALNGIVGSKPSLGALSASGVVPACRTLDTVSIFARDVAGAFFVYREAIAFDERDAYSHAFREPALSAFPSRIRLGVPRPDQLQFFDDKDAATAFLQDVALAKSLGARIVEFDFEPFAEVARALYDGPWVAERYAAVKTLIESNPEAFHAVTREIIESARNSTRLRPSRRSIGSPTGSGKRVAAWSDFDVMLVPTMPRFYTVAEVEADPVGSIPSSGPTPISSTCSICAQLLFLPAFEATVCRRA